MVSNKVEPKYLRKLALIKEDDELLLLSAIGSQSSRPSGRFDLEDLTQDQCWTWFPFRKVDLGRLCQGLGLPDKLVCRNGSVTSGLEVLCILLRRLAYPCRIDDLVELFGKPKDVPS